MNHKSITIWVIPLLLLLLSLSLALFRLGNQSLQPWDEAWYATIARNVSKSTNPFLLHFNGNLYQDHPPLGFFAIAASFKLLGISEFSARFPMAIFGSLAVLLVFFIGKTLKNDIVGFCSSLILLSSRWFLFRARTANLEAVLLFTQLLVFYFAFNLKTRRQLHFLWFSFALSLLSKSAISLTLAPLVLLSTFNFIRADHKHWFLPTFYSLLVFTLTLTPWYLANYLVSGGSFLTHSIFDIGLRHGTSAGVTPEITKRTLLYLHSAIHKWYTPLFVSLSISFLYLKSRPIRWTLAYLLLSAFPYFLSTETQIWHLLPILPPMALLIPLVASEVTTRIYAPLTKNPSGRLFTQRSFSKVGHLLLLLLVLSISISSLRSYWSEFINLPKSVSHEARLAISSRAYPYPLILQDNTYAPTVIFYADQNVEVTQTPSIIKARPRPFQLIAHNYQLSAYSNYSVVDRSGDTVLTIFE